MHSDGWSRRVNGICLTPKCRETAVSEFKRRWCHFHGAEIARIRDEYRQEARIRQKGNTDDDELANFVDPRPGRGKAKPKADAPICRLENCSTKVYADQKCYTHRGVADDISVAAARRVCASDGCTNNAKTGDFCRGCREQHIAALTADPAVATRRELAESLGMDDSSRFNKLINDAVEDGALEKIETGFYWMRRWPPGA